MDKKEEICTVCNREITESKNYDDCIWILYDDLCRIPSDFVGEKVCYEGMIEHIISEDSCNILFSVDVSGTEGYDSDTIIVKYAKNSVKKAHLLEYEPVTVYGTFVGLEPYTGEISGTKVLMPTVEAFDIFQYTFGSSEK